MAHCNYSLFCGSQHLLLRPTLRVATLGSVTLAMNRLSIFAPLVLFLFSAGCVVVDNQYSALPPGKWRAILKIQPQLITPNPKGRPLPDKVDMTYEDIVEGEIPFNFEVIYDNDSTFHLEIINGQERLAVPAKDIHFGRGKSRAVDSIRIDFVEFDSYITGSFLGNTIDGQWVVTNRENYAIPFTAVQGKDYRFTAIQNKPVADLSGKWEATFGLEENDPYPAIAEFRQNGNHLEGTFRTETGDYRFLEGTVQEDKFYLSCFDGAHAFLFTGKIMPDGSLTGGFFSGKHYRTTWEARRNENVELQNPDSLTFLLPGFDKFDFSFENPEGKAISPNNPEYQGKVKIIQIMGTWCPNCRDETQFLLDYLKEKNTGQLSVIGLAFEKYADKAKADGAIDRYKSQLGVNYEIVYAGTNKKEDAAKALPMLNHVMAYPTMVFLDKNNRVRRIHTGFDGPATSRFGAFKKEFGAFVEQLIAEN